MVPTDDRTNDQAIDSPTVDIGTMEQQPISLSRRPAPHIRGAPGTTAVQAVLIPRRLHMSDRAAGEYVISHFGVTPLKVHTTDSYQRFRIVEPEHFSHFITKRARDGVKLVIGYY